MNFMMNGDSLINYYTQYVALCMFSHMTTKFNVNELFDMVTQSEEFIEFMENNKDKTGKEVCQEFVKNSLYSYFDDKVDMIVNDEELQNIFKNKNLSKDDQFKAFIGKSILKFTIGDEGIPDNQRDLFKKFVQQFIKMAIEIKGDNEINSPADFYHLAIEDATKDIVKENHKRLDVLRLGDADCGEIEGIYDSCIGMIDRFNTILSNGSKHPKNKRSRSNKNNNKRNPKRPRK